MSMSRTKEANVLGKFSFLWQPGLSALQRAMQTSEWPCCLQLAQPELALMTPLNTTVPLAFWTWLLPVQEAQSLLLGWFIKKRWPRGWSVGCKSGCLSFHVHPSGYKGNSVSQFASEINIILNPPLFSSSSKEKMSFHCSPHSTF